jgi:3-hydroxybutyryl-CoA dehydrogenase
MSAERIGVVGAGTMGAGIAQIAALGGIDVSLHDPVPEALEQGLSKVREGLDKGASRGRWSEAEVDMAIDRVSPAKDLDKLAGCELVIEAAPEDLELKRSLFAQLAEACGPEAVLATNTSSLPVTAIASGAPDPSQVVGMHFFNPPPLIELVEIVAGAESSEAALELATETGKRMGRTPIRAADGPGFLANRLARPFFLEPLRLLGEGAATHEQIDLACRLGGGFRMGPFELMDLIGIDVNFRVARSFFEQSYGEPRWRPSTIPGQMVAAGRLGRKSGRGYYEYGDGPYRPEDPGVDVEHPVLDEDGLGELAGPEAAVVLPRLIAQIVNEAAFAIEDRIGSPADMDTAMRLGFNWPLGPIEWSEQIGLARAVGLLDEQRELRGEAYRAAPLLRRAAAEGSALREIPD